VPARIYADDELLEAALQREKCGTACQYRYTAGII